MSEMFEAAEEMVEEMFPPKPGGLVDRHRQRKAAEKAAEDEAANRQEHVEQPSYRAVKVAPESPEVFTTNIINVPSDGVVQILPQSPYRYKAFIQSITTGATIAIARDSGSALGGIGFPLAVNLPIILDTRAQVWAYNSGASAAQVAVIAELYAPENC